MIFSRLRRAKIVHYIRKYLNDNFHFSGNHHSKNRTDTPFKLFHSPAFAPPAELKQASKMLGWEIPSPLEENPTHTYGENVKGSLNLAWWPCLGGGGKDAKDEDHGKQGHHRTSYHVDL